jgi:hypothetical protein
VAHTGARIIIGTRSSVLAARSGQAVQERATGRRLPWLDTRQPRPRCPVRMTAGAAGTVTEYTCDRAEGHRGAWHHDQRGYYWRPDDRSWAGDMAGRVHLVDRCATPGHAHQWAEPWDGHIPGGPPITGHRAGRRTQGDRRGRDRNPGPRVG